MTTETRSVDSFHEDGCEIFIGQGRSVPCSCGLDDALDADRRATVERIRVRLAGLSLPLGTTHTVAEHERKTALAILDEEADREAGREPRTPWVRYRLVKDEIVLTFRVPKGTPMVMEQAGWHVEGAVIEAPHS